MQHCRVYGTCAPPSGGLSPGTAYSSASSLPSTWLLSSGRSCRARSTSVSGRSSLPARHVCCFTPACASLASSFRQAGPIANAARPRVLRGALLAIRHVLFKHLPSSSPQWTAQGEGLFPPPLCGLAPHPQPPLTGTCPPPAPNTSPPTAPPTPHTHPCSGGPAVCGHCVCGAAVGGAAPHLPGRQLPGHHVSPAARPAARPVGPPEPQLPCRHAARLRCSSSTGGCSAGACPARRAAWSKSPYSCLTAPFAAALVEARAWLGPGLPAALLCSRRHQAPPPPPPTHLNTCPPRLPAAWPCACPPRRTSPPASWPPKSRAQCRWRSSVSEGQLQGAQPQLAQSCAAGASTGRRAGSCLRSLRPGRCRGNTPRCRLVGSPTPSSLSAGCWCCNLETPRPRPVAFHHLLSTLPHPHPHPHPTCPCRLHHIGHLAPGPAGHSGGAGPAGPGVHRLSPGALLGQVHGAVLQRAKGGGGGGGRGRGRGGA